MKPKSASKKSAPAASDGLSSQERSDYAAVAHLAVLNADDRTRKKLARIGVNSTDDLSDGILAGGKAPLVAETPSRMRVASIRFLLARANGGKFRQSLAESGVDWLDVQRIKWSDPVYCAASDYVERLRVEMLAQKAIDSAESLVDGDDSAEKMNAKMVMFALERVKREQFADPKNDPRRQSVQIGGGVTYNITFQGGRPDGNLCGVCVDKCGASNVIDIK